MQTISKSRVSFYYPYLRIQNEDWLKSALLYWDKLRILVPEQQTFDDFQSIQLESVRCASKQGLVERTSFAPYVDAAYDLFVRAAQMIEQTSGKSMAQYAEAAFKCASERIEDDSSVLPLFELSTKDPSFSILSAKMSERMKYLLEQYGFAEVLSDRHFLPASGARLYLMCLAFVATYNCGANLVTDTPEFANFSSGISLQLDGGFDPAVTTNQIMLELGIPLPSPWDLRNVSIERILEFREEHDKSRRSFVDTVESFVSLVSTARSNEMLSDILQVKKQEVDDSIAEYRSKWKVIIGETIGKALVVRTPLAWMGTMPAWIADAGVTLLLANAISAGVRQVDENSNSPWHYLLCANKTFLHITAQ